MVIVGSGSTALGPEAFVWDPAHGIRNLRDVLTNEFGLGADLAGWSLVESRGVTTTGALTFIGTGVNPDGQVEAWIAAVPEPATAWLLASGIAGLAAWRWRTRGATIR